MVRVSAGAIHEPGEAGLVAVDLGVQSASARVLIMARAVTYAGWKTAIVLPSGSLNHAERPMGVVAMWFTVLNVGVS